jgi:hypothetical protein
MAGVKQIILTIRHETHHMFKHTQHYNSPIDSPVSSNASTAAIQL